MGNDVKVIDLEKIRKAQGSSNRVLRLLHAELDQTCFLIESGEYPEKKLRETAIAKAEAIQTKIDSRSGYSSYSDIQVHALKQSVKKHGPLQSGDIADEPGQLPESGGVIEVPSEAFSDFKNSQVKRDVENPDDSSEAST